MRPNLRSVFSVATVTALLFGLATDVEAQEAYPRPELLVEPAELGGALERFTVLDARLREAYDAGHVPGAMHVEHAAWEQAFYEDEDRSPAGWGQRIAALGITSGKPVVVYDDNRSKDAARIWWILKYYGVRDAKLLNGGWKGWSAGAFEVSTETRQPARSDFKPVPQRARFRDLAETLAATKPGIGVQIVDARSYAEHCGDERLDNARGGAIPGAKQLEWSDLLDPETARFKTADEIRRLFVEAGIDPLRPTVTHCQSGGRASVMAFALELMGGERIANYYRGWSEWGNSDNTPIRQE